MAEGKKSFVLYTDLIQSISHLTNEEKGILFNHLLEYVNDMNPVLTDRLLLTAWKPIELSLKRDLEKFNKALEEKSISGRLGNLKRWNKDLFDLVVSESMTLEAAEVIAKGRKVSHTDENNRTPLQSVANIADSVSDNVSVSDSVNDNVKLNTIEERKLKFAQTLEPFLPNYGKELLNEFYLYWVEPDKSKKKMRFEGEKYFDVSRRLSTWAKKEKNFAQKQESAPSRRTTNEIFDKVKEDILNGQLEIKPII